MINKSKKILTEISPGELLDKISILEIKMDKVKDENSQKEIKKEYKILKEIQNSTIDLKDKVQDLFKSLKKVNIVLWDIEDKLRIYEKKKDFSEEFIELARGVYFNNDKRAKIKNEINIILKSNFKEVKQYIDYNI
tara:strand:- start:37 stop:444 length:408 start_codon:yes stop_codon:yes gene_type:complete